ncbi:MULTISPECIES: hypothetical protein [unclassified Bradyrhizobium]|uniref:hypothetical protein n=1 Tax=Bradyrhizobium sp. USDA 4541 TaxID=2817704 RepID=UPI0020A40CA7|nr:hypothetical protein [Bradyrhizobium sp. USDA 4541]MCP1848720.1 hypothetical protein [Bradyrhizobium sp. USDA 4541]
MKKPVPRVALLSDEEVRDAQIILQELLEGEFADIREMPRSSNLIIAAFQGGRDSRIAWIQRIHRQLKARLLVLHVDEESHLEKQLLVFFKEEDVRRINDLLSEVRTLVRDNADLSGDHKRRLLRIVNKFQAELEKSKSSFRVFLDGFVEASEALGEAGQKVKPAFDRIREILGIAEKSFGENPQIEGPSEPKQLPAPNEVVPGEDE